MVTDTNARDFPLKARWTPDFSEASGLAVYTESELSSLAFKAASALDLNAVKIHGYPIDSPSAEAHGQVLTWDSVQQRLTWEASGGGGGSVASATNIGAGTGYIFSGINGNLIYLRTLRNADGTVSISTDASSIVLSVGTLSHASLTNLTTGNPHPQYVYKNPTSPTQNEVQAGNTTTVPIILKGSSGQTAELFKIVKDDDNELVVVTAGGNLSVQGGINANDQRITQVATPVAGTDAVNASYVSSLLGVSGVLVSKEADSAVGPRQEINFSAVNINLTVVDNPSENRIDITLSGSTGGVGGGAGGAPSGATYIVSGLDSGLTNELILNASGGLQLQYTGSATLSIADSGVTEGKIADGAVSNAKIRDSAAVSVLGRSANSAGDIADITAGANSRFLSRKSDTVGFNAIETTDLPYSPAPASAIYVVSGTDGLLSNERTLNASGGLILQYTAASATLSVSDLGISTGKIADNAVTYGKIQQMSGQSVLGKPGTGTGAVTEITAGADNTFLARKSGTVAFGSIQTTDLPYTPAPASAIYIVSGSDSLLSNERTFGASGGATVLYTASTATVTLLSELDSTARINVAHQDAIISTRRTINFLQGNAIEISVGDDSGNEEAEITISTSLGAGGEGQVFIGGGGGAGSGTGELTYVNGVLGTMNIFASGNVSATGNLALRISGASSFTLSGIPSANRVLSLPDADGTLALQSYSAAPASAIYIVSGVDGLLSNERTLNASGGLQLDYTTGSATLSIQDEGVSNAKIRDSAALSVLGRSANSTGDIADITAGSNGHYLRRSSDTLGFGAITSGDLPTHGNANHEFTYVYTSATPGPVYRMVAISQTAYDALGTKDPNTLYVVSGA